MGGCGGKVKVPVHEIILNECYDCLGQQSIISEQQLNQMSNKQKIEGAVRLHARTLADHIADTQNKLKDALILIRQKLMRNFKEDYGYQWATLIILEILVGHTKDFTPHPRRATLIPGDDYKLDVSMGKDSQQVGQGQNKKKSQKMLVIEDGKNKDFRGQFDEEKVVKIAQKRSKSKEEKKRNKKKKQEKRYNDEQQQQGDDYQVTFFNENLLRFESEFVEMMIAILDKNQNPFYQSSFLQCMSLIERFSAVHKDWYTAERVQFLGDSLQSIIISMINIFVTSQPNNNKSSQNPPVIVQQQLEQMQIPPRSNSNGLDSNYLRTITADKDSQFLIRQETVSKNEQGGAASHKQPQEDANNSMNSGYSLLLSALSKAMKAYSATIEKIRTQGKVFSSESQSDFFMICLNTLRQLEEQQVAQQQPLQQSSSSPISYPFEIKISALQILKVFSKRCFILQKSTFLVELIFCFFDSCEWKYQNLFEEVLQTVQTVFNTESLVLSFQQDVFIHLLSYLQGHKNYQKLGFSQQSQSKEMNLNQIEKQGKEGQENGVINKDSLEKLPNSQKTQVLIKALEFFSKIIAKEPIQSQLLVHQISRVVKSFLTGLSSVQEKELIQKKKLKNNQILSADDKNDPAILDLRKSLESAFVQFALKIVVDSQSLLGLLLEISNDICDRLSGSTKIKSYTNLNNSSFQGINDPYTADKLEDGLQGIQGQKKNQLGQQDQEGQPQVEDNTINSKISYGKEGMRLIEVILCNISDVVQGDMGGGYPCEDLLANLAYLTTFKQVSILSFKNISQVLILKAKSDRDYKQEISNNNNNNNITSPKIYQNHHNLHHPPGEFSQTCILHILYAILRSLLIVGNQSSQVFSAVIVAQYALMVTQQIVSNNETLLLAPVIAFLLKLINETQKYTTGREINVNTTEVYAREYGSTNNAYFVANILSKLQEEDKQEQEEQQVQQQQQNMENNNNINGNTTNVSMRHASSYNICQILAYEMIVVLSQAIPGLTKVVQVFKDNQEYTERTKSLGGIMKELLRCYQEGLDVDGENNNYGENNNNNNNYTSEIVVQLCQHIHNVEFIESQEIATGEITELINKSAYDIGITQHLDFDALTAQFTRNFTSAVRSIDIHKSAQKGNNNNNINNSGNVSGSYSVFNTNNQINNRNNNNNNNIIENNNDSSFASQIPKSKNMNLSGIMNTHESTGPFEIEDTQFQNVLNMIQNHNHKIPNMFPDLPQVDSHRSGYSQNQRSNNQNNNNNNSYRKSSEIEVQIN